MSRFNRLRWSKRSWIWTYGVVVLSITSAMIISLWLTPHIGFPGTLFLCVVMLSAWFGGVGPGLLATTLSALAFHYYFLHPISSLAPQPREMPRLLMYVISNLLIALLSAAQRNAAESLRLARDELNRTVQDLQKTNEVLHAESRERKQTEEVLHQAQADLARVNRVSSMGELTASLAHEVNQPIAATVTSANSCIRWLAGDVPNLDKARAAAARIVNDGTRAAEIITRIRLLFQKGTLQLELVDVNEVIEQMILLLHGEATRHSISVRTELAADLPQVMGDRVQLQQVVMNLMTNSIDAMKAMDETRELAIKSNRDDNEQLLVTVSDTGVGLPPEQVDQIFNAFFTTKPHGTGMGLRICRSIVESHGGRLWAGDNSPRGASFYVSLPTKVEARE
jgi:C4-dicarboxylate-specific signal transduction histidine kinase